MQPVCASHDEVYHYQEVTGTSIKAVEWRLKKGGQYTLTYTSTGEKKEYSSDFKVPVDRREHR